MAMNEAEIGRLYVQTCQDTMYTRGSWFRYEGGVWQEEHENTIRNEVWDILEELESNDMIRPSSRLVAGVLRYIQDHVFVKEESVDARPNLINLQNGTYDLDAQALLSHDKRHYLTTQLPFSYDARAECPTWEYYLASSLTQARPNERDPDPELILFLQEAIGYSLTADISHHTSFWCFGQGANGKGVLFYVLECLAGSSAAPLNINLLKRDRYQLADLAGKRIALCSEATSFDNVVEDGDVKALIAGDKMMVRQIRERPFQLEPKVKLWWSMNRLPTIADTSEGFWRRVKVIPFNRSFAEAERQRDLKDRLALELPGIFNWAMMGLVRLRRDEAFTIPAQVAAQTAQYKEDSNVVGMFVSEECKPSPGHQISSSRLYKRFKQWASDNGYRPFSVRNFKRELIDLGYSWKHVRSGNVVEGLEINVTAAASSIVP